MSNSFFDTTKTNDAFTRVMNLAAIFAAMDDEGRMNGTIFDIECSFQMVDDDSYDDEDDDDSYYGEHDDGSYYDDVENDCITKYYRTKLYDVMKQLKAEFPEIIIDEHFPSKLNETNEMVKGNAVLKADGYFTIDLNTSEYAKDKVVSRFTEILSASCHFKNIKTN